MKGHHLRSSLPRFPGKKSKLWTNHGDLSFVEDRRIALEQYMKVLLQVRRGGGQRSGGRGSGVSGPVVQAKKKNRTGAIYIGRGVRVAPNNYEYKALLSFFRLA